VPIDNPLIFFAFAAVLLVVVGVGIWVAMQSRKRNSETVSSGPAAAEMASFLTETDTPSDAQSVAAIGDLDDRVFRQRFELSDTFGDEFLASSSATQRRPSRPVRLV